MAEPLEELGKLFTSWRKNKKYKTEAVPEDLLKRAKELVAEHGKSKVADVAKIDPKKLGGPSGTKTKATKAAKTTKTKGAAKVATKAPPPMKGPARPVMAAKSSGSDLRPIAEVQSPQGFCFRIFRADAESLKLVDAFMKHGRLS